MIVSIFMFQSTSKVNLLSMFSKQITLVLKNLVQVKSFCEEFPKFGISSGIKFSLKQNCRSSLRNSESDSYPNVILPVHGKRRNEWNDYNPPTHFIHEGQCKIFTKWVWRGIERNLERNAVNIWRQIATTTTTVSAWCLWKSYLLNMIQKEKG